MKKILATILIATLTLLSILSPPAVLANDSISTEDQIFDDDLLELGYYDAVTQTTTTYTVSLSDLKAQNEATKERLGLSGQNVMMGYQPPRETKVSASNRSITNQNNPVDVTEDPYDSVMFLDLKFDLDNDGQYDYYGSSP